MIKTWYQILSLFLLFGFTSTIQAQFINLQIRVEPELSATVEQDLNFGTQVTNSGRMEIQLGDINMGVFSIKAYYTQNVYLNLTYPEVLRNDNPAIDAEIPMGLNISYNNSGNNAPQNATLLPDNGGMVSVHESTKLRNRNDIWKEMFIYVYGYIEIGNIPNGVYTGDIVLSVDYD